MTQADSQPPRGPRGTRRAAVVPSGQLVSFEPGESLPVQAGPAVADVDLVAWAGEHGALVEEKLHAVGAVLFRGFEIREPARFEALIAALYPQLTGEIERSSPRHQVEGNVYTSTDHPADQPIFLHNEMSYSRTWPMRLGFCCLVAPATGGETPIADTRQILRSIPADVRERFERLGVSYVRNYGDGFGLPWQESFGTDDPAVVEAYCAEHGIVAEWKDRNRLRTRRTGPAVAEHPVTGEQVWFNHATFFHVSTLAPDLRDGLLAELAPDELPTNSFYGDGSPIESDVLEQLRAAYAAATVSFRWQKGDVLLIDNMLSSHGRAPFTGARKVVVAMAEPVTGAEDVSA